MKYQTENFWPKCLITFDYETRLKISNEMIKSGEMDEKYSLVTMSMDGTHHLMQLQSQYPSDSQYSYKLKDIAYNMLVIIGNYVVYLLNLVGCFNKWLVVLGRKS